jgi:NADH dehydrogenase FAD-containing subunit
MATLGRRHGIAVLGRVPVAGLPGWFVARGYHLVQLPLRARRVRVLADWLTAALFRRDVAELTVAGAP